MTHYDFFVAGRWRNWPEVKKVLNLVRDNGFSAYCFIENLYKGAAIEFEQSSNIDEIMKKIESLSHDDKFIREIFATDMSAQKAADRFLVVLPVGISGHIEAGVAYGLGKQCYAVGAPEKTETLYQIFDSIFADNHALNNWLKKLDKA